MAEEINVELVKRETIKPSSPTPFHLKSFKLSFLDQIVPAVYTSLVLFYPNDSILTSDQKTSHLKKSLSEALTLFYPLAGRVKDDATIECNDEGAQYVEAKINGLLSTFLEEEKDEAVIRRFLPAESESPEAASTWPLLVVQLTFFECGGLAIGVSASHKLADAATLRIFLKTWGCREVVPDFDAAAHYRPADNFSFPPPAALELKKVDCVAKRFVLDKLKIASLKAKADSDGVRKPTRVEVVTALVWRCLMGASRSTMSLEVPFMKPRYSLLMQIVNMRKRVEPPFSENSVGNLALYFTLLADQNKIYKNNSSEEPPFERQLQDLAAKLRRGINEFSEKKAKRFRGEEAFRALVEHCTEGYELITRDDVHFHLCTSWCNFGFYNVDLGLGNPIYVAIPSAAYENTTLLMDTKDGGGVEVALTLSKENMALFATQLDNILS